MSAECIASMIKSFITSTDKTTTFDDVMSLIKAWSCKIFIDRMNLKVMKWVNRSDGMLPDISNYIIKISSFKKVDRIG